MSVLSFAVLGTEPQGDERGALGEVERLERPGVQLVRELKALRVVRRELQAELGSQPLRMTAQAMRAPALPVGCDL
jgi:hypothetical protein